MSAIAHAREADAELQRRLRWRCRRGMRELDQLLDATSTATGGRLPTPSARFSYGCWTARTIGSGAGSWATRPRPMPHSSARRAHPRPAALSGGRRAGVIGALLALGLLCGLSRCWPREMPRALAWPLALAALATARWLARRERAPTAAAAACGQRATCRSTLDGEPLQRRRSCNGAARWPSCAGATHDGRSGTAGWWPDTLSPRARRELRLAVAAACRLRRAPHRWHHSAAYVQTHPCRHRPALPARQAPQRLHLLHLAGLDPRHRPRRGRADHHAGGDERLPARDPRPHAADGRARHRQRLRRAAAGLAACGARGRWPTSASPAPRPTSRPRRCSPVPRSQPAIVRGVVPARGGQGLGARREDGARASSTRPARPAASTSCSARNWRCGWASASATA